MHLCTGAFNTRSISEDESDDGMEAQALARAHVRGRTCLLVRTEVIVGSPRRTARRPWIASSEEITCDCVCVTRVRMLLLHVFMCVSECVEADVRSPSLPVPAL